jgi:hypothetical protein
VTAFKGDIILSYAPSNASLCMALYDVRTVHTKWTSAQHVLTQVWLSNGLVFYFIEKKGTDYCTKEPEF